MKNNALKKHIYEFIERADDNTLQVVYKFLEANVVPETPIYTLTPEQDAEIERRIKEYESGKSKTYTHAQARKIIESLLKK
jgi:putative addiction module component (TIGR02574 family)